MSDVKSKNGSLDNLPKTFIYIITTTKAKKRQLSDSLKFKQYNLITESSF